MAKFDIAIVMGLFIFVVGLQFLIYWRRYKRVPPNKAMIVYGKAQRKRPGAKPFSIVTGGGKFLIPIIEEAAYISLEAHTIDVTLNDIRIGTPQSRERVKIISEAIVRIPSEPAILDMAAIHLLGKSDDEVKEIAQKIIEGHIRNLCANKSFNEIDDNIGTVAGQIAMYANNDLNKVGLDIVSFNLKDIIRTLNSPINKASPTPSR